MQASLDKILCDLVMVDNPAHYTPRGGYKHPGVAFLRPSTCKGAIRVFSRERAVLTIGNKACPFLVFIGNETPTGVWRNKPADFLDMKLAQYVSHSWCDQLVTHHVSGLLHQQKKERESTERPDLEE